MKYYIIAGEASGDLHGSNLMRGLFSEDSSCDVRFWGGDRMASVGGTMVRHYRETAVMGAVEVLMKAGRILDNLSFCKKDILEYAPDAVILIDYPGFNMKIARFAKNRGLKVFYYIPPKVWARGEHRIKALKKYVDKVFVIFPFETDYFRAKNVDFEYVGNPLIDCIRQSLADCGTAPVRSGMVALLPGSRQAELKFLMPRFVELERIMRRDETLSGYRLVIAGAPSMEEADFRTYLPDDSSMEVIFGKTYEILSEADAAVVSSGTASLEAALIGTPQVVCYGFNKITYLLARLLVHNIKYISLANLILDKLIFKELIQDQASPAIIYEELKRLLTDNGCRDNMATDYATLRDVLGGGGASRRVAAAVIDSLS